MNPARAVGSLTAKRSHAAPDGAWIGSGLLLAINMALLTELARRAPGNSGFKNRGKVSSQKKVTRTDLA